MSARAIFGVLLMYVGFLVFVVHSDNMYFLFNDPVPGYVIFLAGATLATHNEGRSK